KLLLVGNWNINVYEEAIAEGFRSCGVEVKAFDLLEYFGNNFISKLQKKAKLGPILNSISRDLENAAFNFDADVIFLNRPVYVYSSAIERIKSRSDRICIVSYNNDNPFSDGRSLFWRHYLDCLRYCDVNFFYRPSNVKIARKKGFNNPRILLPYYVKGFHRPMEVGDEFQSDVVFIGHYEDDGRLELIENLAEHGIDVKVYGNRWSEARNSQWIDTESINPVYGTDYVRLISGSKVALSFLSSMNNDVYTRRCFEIPACGTAMVCERTNELTNIFEPGKEVFFFSDGEEMVSKVRLLLNNPSTRAEIEKKGREKIINGGFDNISRMKSVLSTINKLCKYS
ncbi:MAG: glycosyltransferase, partial [Candidatus Paceibacteria bacterium]